MSLLLGIDLGSSSVKVALVDTATGRPLAAASAPAAEAPIKALRPGWAEQRPDDWWSYLRQALQALQPTTSLNNVTAIGISYQMHGLVCLDEELRPLRDAIIWCDSRGVPYGERAFLDLGHDFCLSTLLNSPGNFTATKLAWVKENEPELFDRIKYIMLPGDYFAMRLTGTPATTACGLSEMMLWDFRGEKCKALLDYFRFPHDILPPLVPTFGEQGRVSAEAAAELGLPEGIPVAYRAGDQPNNALSLGVLYQGQVAATAGTSGVVYGVITCGHGPQTTRVNTFLHVNHTQGVMHCVNGCGILNAWMHREVAPDLTYDAMNELAASVPVGSEGVSVIPFGNGPERVLANRTMGCSVHGVDFNRHTRGHLLRAAQEGVAFSLMYGMELMGPISTIRAGRANMFLSPVFRETLATVSGATIELYDTDGAVGAARGAGMGAGIYKDADEALASLRCLGTTEPDTVGNSVYREAYSRWKHILFKQ